MADIALNMQTDSSKPMRACNWCGSIFIGQGTSRNRQKFCGPKCREYSGNKARVARNKADRPHISIRCGFCGVVFSRFSSGKVRAELTLYCSDDCRRLARNFRIRKTDFVRSCAHCLSDFTAFASNQKFCGTLCKARSRREKDHNKLREYQRKQYAERALSMILLPVTAQPKV